MDFSRRRRVKAQQYDLRSFVVLRSFLVGGLAITTIAFGLWIAAETVGFQDLALSLRRPIFVLSGAVAPFLVMTLASGIIHKRLRQVESSELKFRSLLEAAPDAIVLTDLSGRIILVNTQTENLFGYTRHELLGEPVDRLFRRPALEAHSGVGLTGTLTSSQHVLPGPEYSGRRKDGSAFPVEIHCNPLQTEEGQLVISSIRDITESKRRERRRTARHAVGRILMEAATLQEAAPGLLRAICESLEWDFGALWIVEPNPQGMRCLDLWQEPALEGAALIALSREARLSPGDGLLGRLWQNAEAAWIANLREVPNCGRVAAAAEEGLQAAFCYPLTSGNEVIGLLEFWTRQSRQPEDNLIATLQTVGQQIGQFLKRKQAEETLRRTEEQFRQAQKIEAVGRLAGGIAHDFNNLLTIILSCGDLLLHQLKSEGPARDHVEGIIKAGEQAAALTRQLLAFSRKQVLEPRVFDLNGVVAELNKMLARLIGEDIEFATHTPASLPPVKADPGQIEQVLMNLVLNARDAMPKGGKLTIETGSAVLDETWTSAYPELKPGLYTFLAVSDTGCGMDDAVKARVFEPFFTTKEQGKGTGLGLAMVYGIVKQSGGHITVASAAGLGTMFKIYLPSAQEPVAPSRPSPKAIPFVQRGGTVLLVEDEDGVRRLTRTVLQNHGYTVLEARHGEEALQLCEQHGDRVHLIVTDMVMPGMNGRELAERLLHMRPQLKVLFISGYTGTGLEGNGLFETGTAFLQKPFTSDALTNKVQEVLCA